MPKSIYIRGEDLSSEQLDKYIKEAKYFTRVALAKGLSLVITPGSGRAYYVRHHMKNGIRHKDVLGQFGAISLAEAKRGSEPMLGPKMMVISQHRRKAPTPQVLYRLVLIPAIHEALFAALCKALGATVQDVPLPIP
jgi:hypothetical protein